jgi:hypothetical protein
MHRTSRAAAPRAATLLTAATLALAAGCYSYVPVTPAASRPGTELRVTIAEPGAAELARFLGPRAASVEGNLVASSDTGVTLSITTITRSTGVEETWPGDQVVIPKSAIARTETRRLARGRTVGLTAAFIAASALLGAALSNVEDITRGGTRPGNPGRQ